MAGRTQPLGKDAYFSYPRIGRTATADIRIQVRGHVIPIRVTGPAVHTVIPITADEDAKGTPAKNLFTVLRFKCYGPCATASSLRHP